MRVSRIGRPEGSRTELLVKAKTKSWKEDIGIIRQWKVGFHPACAPSYELTASVLINHIKAVSTDNKPSAVFFDLIAVSFSQARGTEEKKSGIKHTHKNTKKLKDT